jgi:hypothetical protein
MRLQRIPFYWVAAALVVVAMGCQQSSEPPTQPVVAPTPLAPDTVLRAHWTGKHALGVAASAYSLMRLWELPESKQLQAYLLSRLGVTMFGASGPESGAPIPAAALLMEDLVDREWFVELRRRTNQPPQFVFAIRLNEARAKSWRGNLAGAFSSATGAHPTMKVASWTLKHPRTQQLIELHQVAGWTLVGASMGQNELLAETSDRIRRDGAPVGWQQAVSWLELDADLDWLAGQLPMTVSSNASLPRLALTIGGDGAHAVTRATLDFTESLNLQLPPWQFPTERISSPIVGFTALRGFAGCLDSNPTWQRIGLNATPDQCFVWADAAMPLQMHFAAPAPAGMDLRRAGVDWIQRGNAWLKQNGIGQMVARPEGVGVVWQGLPVLSPFVTAASNGTSGWILGGLIADASPAPGAPPAIYPRLSLDELVADIQGRSNLVAYAWETTGSRAESFYLLSQVSRVARLHPQLPAEAPSAQWIQSVRQRLGNATTTVSLTASNQLTLERRSTTGLTAAELHLLSDWMESPDFPRGLYSTRTRRAASAAEFQSQP